MIFQGITKFFLRIFQKKRWYRPNAAVIIVNEKGEVLLCERKDRPGSVQTVQGGIEPGESPEQAAKREVLEEVGLDELHYEVKTMLPNTYRYDWPPAVQTQLSYTGYRGQEQYFFLFEVQSDVRFDLNRYDREFSRVWWGSPKDLLRLSWSNKRPGIEAALKGFHLLS
ncbi:MAG: NUDIX domain-containing protein [Patescibacteria group bacterium]|jgi:putative (di)nucleoside polyphosphate hydrolase